MSYPDHIPIDTCIDNGIPPPAAYLIRTVYQILTVTGRSLSASEWTLSLSDDAGVSAESMARLNEWLTAAHMEYRWAKGGRIGGEWKL